MAPPDARRGFRPPKPSRLLPEAIVTALARAVAPDWRRGSRLTKREMRPDILNPLFAEVEVLKGIGPALAKPLKRLGLSGSSTCCSTSRPAGSSASGSRRSTRPMRAAW